MTGKEQANSTAERFGQPIALVLWLGAAIALVAAIALPVQQLLQSGGAATLDIDNPGSRELLATVPGLPPNTYLEPPYNGVTVNVVVESDPTGEPIPWTLRLLTDLGTSVWAAGLGVVAALLAILLTRIATGNPFHRGNAALLRWLALTIAVASAGADTFNLLAAHAFVDYLDLSAPLEAVHYYSIPPFFLALLILLLASAFARGRALQEDVEGLV